MINIKLSKRLKCIANMVDSNTILADIGCDHALLDIYLLKNGIINKAIACDITPGALYQAKKNIELYKVNNIDTRLSDGLSKISKSDNVDVIVMSGLGDQKIIKILKENIDKLKSVNSIIIQSNTSAYKIRKYITSVGYYISNEKLVKEKNIIYTVVKFVKGYKKYKKKELIYGPLLLKNKDDLFINELINMINKNNEIINKIPKSMVLKKIKLRLVNNGIKRIMK